MARSSTLRYVDDSVPGLRRERRGKGFVYQRADGRQVRDPKTLARIRSLVIPPAWTEVWICPDPRGHMQATGRDARGRKQYRYHPQWRQQQEEVKYDRVLAFGKVLPRIRRATERDLRSPKLSRKKVLAVIVQLLERTLMRVGNEEYARSNKSYGLSTLRDRHVRVRGAKIQLQFKGKSGKHHTLEVHDSRLAKLVKACQDIPGQELFQYIDENGIAHDVRSTDVNEYLREISGENCTAKDFRTFAGTVLAALALQELESFDSQAQAKRNLTQAVERVAKQLGNTPTICRKCYVHPAVFDSYLDGSLLQTLKSRTEARIKRGFSGLKKEEAAVLAFLQARLSRTSNGTSRNVARRRAGSVNQRSASH